MQIAGYFISPANPRIKDVAASMIDIEMREIVSQPLKSPSFLQYITIQIVPIQLATAVAASVTGA